MAQSYYDDKPPPYSPYSEDMNTPLVPHGVPPAQSSPVGFIPPPPLPPGYVPQQSFVPPQPYPSYGTTVTVAPTAEIVIIGGCPICKCGILEKEFTLCGILCCILFFPIGLLCCIAMQRRRCSNCDASFD
ncbi:hypothetical protein CHUAL_011709 [Chamberlinius hualienensis]